MRSYGSLININPSGWSYFGIPPSPLLSSNSVVTEEVSLSEPSGESVMPSSISCKSRSSLVQALPWLEIALEHSIQYPGVGIKLCGKPSQNSSASICNQKESSIIHSPNPQFQLAVIFPWRFGTEGRTDSLCEKSDHYWAGLWSVSWIISISFINYSFYLQDKA